MRSCLVGDALSQYANKGVGGFSNIEFAVVPVPFGHPIERTKYRCAGDDGVARSNGAIAHAQFDKYLKQFEGQSAIVVACGAQVTLGDQETTITAGDLNSALKEAGWNVDTLHSLSIDRACFPGAESIVVFRRSDAPIATRDAALTLVAVIDTVLSQLVEPIVPNRPVDFTLNGAVVASDTIEVLVQRHPMRPTGPSQGDTKLLKRVSSSGLSRRPKRDPARQR